MARSHNPTIVALLPEDTPANTPYCKTWQCVDIPPGVVKSLKLKVFPDNAPDDVMYSVKVFDSRPITGGARKIRTIETTRAGCFGNMGPEMTDEQRWVGWLLIVGAFVVFAVATPEYWLRFGVVGVLLVAISFVIPFMKKGGAMEKPEAKEGEIVEMPQSWDEQEIELGLERYKQSPNLLSTYVDGICSRFIMGQNMQTMQVRTKFMETFNKYAEVARESYKWQRTLKVRAKIEEDIIDLELQLKHNRSKAGLDGLKDEATLRALEAERQQLEKRLQIEQIKQMADLSRPDPPPPPPPPSEKELREQLRRELDEREQAVLRAMKETRANTSLSKEQKQRKLNILEDELAEIHEQQARLL